MAITVFTLVNALLSGLFAGFVSVTVTFLVEKLGAIGALIGTSPTTIIPASIGFAFAFQNDIANENQLIITLYSTMPGMLINCLYILSIRIIANLLPIKHKWIRFAICIGGALFIWLLLMTGFVVYKLIILDHFVAPSMLRYVFIAVGIGAYLIHICMGLTICYHMPPKTSASSKKSSWKEFLLKIFLRGAFTFLVIAISVFLSQLNSFIAGVASVFPAIFTTSIISLWISNGEQVVLNAIPSMILGSTAVLMYCIACASTLLRWGIVGSVIFSYVTAVSLNTLPFYFYMQWRTNK